MEARGRKEIGKNQSRGRQIAGKCWARVKKFLAK
jgi:hypothetical protein